MEQVARVSLLEQADLALERDARIFQAYARDYRECHAARHRRAEEATARLESHEGWTKADAATRERLHASIGGLECAGPGTVALATAPDGRCPQCRVSLGELRGQLELLDAREQRALRELDALLSPPPPPAEPGDEPITITLDLTSADDLPELHRKIDEVGKDALTRPRRVRVSFETPR